MSPNNHRIRKYPSGHQKRLKKKRIEELIQSQKGALQRFMVREPQSKIETVVSEQHKQEELNDNENVGEENVEDKEESPVSNSSTEPRNLCSLPVKTCPGRKIRKYPSGHQTRIKKKRIEELVQSQRGALDRFIVKDPQASVEGLVHGQQHDEEWKDDEFAIEECKDVNGSRTAIPNIPAPASLVLFFSLLGVCEI